MAAHDSAHASSTNQQQLQPQSSDSASQPAQGKTADRRTHSPTSPGSGASTPSETASQIDAKEIRELGALLSSLGPL